MRTLVLGTAGHIDHGKSALVEALTGTHPDRLAEEQARGITIELGFGHLRVGDVSVALVDVPGHERFVRTMLAGAGGLDAVLLVIAADEGIKPQTREHFAICQLLRLERGLIVLTKSDLVDEDTRALVELEARDLVAGSPLSAAPIIATSARTGAGLDELRHAIAVLAADRRPRQGPSRVPIDRAFTVKGFGTVVTGTLVSGGLRVDDELVLLPSDRPTRVRGLQVHGATMTEVSAPRRVAANLGGVDLSDVRRGMTLAAKDSMPVTRRIDVRIELLPSSPPLRHGARVRVHQGTAEAAARVSLSAVRGTAREPWKPLAAGEVATAVVPGGEALARLRLATPLVLTRGDLFVLRAPAPVGTLGGGRILDPEPSRGGVRRVGTARRLETLAEADVMEAARVWLAAAGTKGMSAQDLGRRAGLARGETLQILQDLDRAGEVRLCGPVFVSVAVLQAAARALRAMLETFHRDHPAEAGLAREQVRDEMARQVPPQVFDAILAEANVATADRLALPTHRPAVSGEAERLRDAVVNALQAAGLQSPDAATLAGQLGVSAPVVQSTLIALTKERRIARLGDLWFHIDVLAALKEAVKSLGAGATFDVGAAKARFDVSRKFAIPLLEYLDRERVTRRVGDKRVVL